MRNYCVFKLSFPNFIQVVLHKNWWTVFRAIFFSSVYEKLYLFLTNEEWRAKSSDETKLCYSTQLKRDLYLALVSSGLLRAARFEKKTSYVILSELSSQGSIWPPPPPFTFWEFLAKSEPSAKWEDYGIEEESCPDILGGLCTAVGWTRTNVTSGLIVVPKPGIENVLKVL